MRTSPLQSLLFTLLLTPAFTPAVEAAEPEPSTESDTESSLTHPNYPRFQRLRPQWGVELTGSINAWGQQALVAEQGDAPSRAFSLHFEYQPQFLQSLGVVSFGPSVAIYPMMGTSALPSVFSVFTVGGQIRYQARYFREQVIVPVVGYSWEHLTYTFSNGSSGGFGVQGPLLGLWFLLNVLEPATATQFYAYQGVLRSYFVLESRSLSGEDSKPLSDGRTLTISGSSYFFGFRLEY